MARTKSSYQCSSCEATQPKWSGQCADCGAWNTLEEMLSQPAAKASRHAGYAGAGSVRIERLDRVGGADEERTRTGIDELDRVLGGGLVSGSVVLIGGDPGIGKSTLLLQAVGSIGRQLSSLYVTGEESLQQIALRARRLGLDASGLQCVTATCVEQVLALAGDAQPGLLVIDSIQTLYSEQLQSAPGSVSQLRDSAAALVRWAKSTGCVVVLVGHVTKEGTLAGPRVLEHMVDAVLYFESDSGSRYRVVRAVKNRFGTVNELGVFAMTEGGLKQVQNPSAIFLSGHTEPVTGSAVTVVREGSRPLLVEIQALVDPSHLANPRRVALGVDAGRLSMLLAVLHRHGGIQLADHDVFVNVVGGMRLSGTGSDMPVIMAILSSFRDVCLPRRQALFGEVGLSGEIRPVHHGEDRLREAAGHGFEKAVVPKANLPRKPIGDIEVVGVNDLQQAIDAVFA